MNMLNHARVDRQFKTNCAAFTERVRELNDQCRRSGNYVLPYAITDRGPAEVSRIKEKIVNYDDFDKIEDSLLERDFGTIQHGRLTIAWVIDLHAPENTTLDPSDPDKSIRILNVHLTDER